MRLLTGLTAGTLLLLAGCASDPWLDDFPGADHPGRADSAVAPPPASSLSLSIAPTRKPGDDAAATPGDAHDMKNMQHEGMDHGTMNHTQQGEMDHTQMNHEQPKGGAQ